MQNSYKIVFRLKTVQIPGYTKNKNKEALPRIKVLEERKFFVYLSFIAYVGSSGVARRVIVEHKPTSPLLYGC